VPPGDARLFKLALDATSKRFRPITKKELAGLQKIAAETELIFRLAA
jgi:hypothetical protein